MQFSFTLRELRLYCKEFFCEVMWSLNTLNMEGLLYQLALSIC